MGGEERPGLLTNTAVGALVGAMYGSVISAWVAPPVGPSDGVAITVDALPSFRTMWRHVGGQALVFAAVAASFSVGEAFGQAVRGKQDVVGAISGGAFAGLAVGARQKTFGHGSACVIGFATLSGVVHMAHGSMFQHKEEQEARMAAVR